MTYERATRILEQYQDWKKDDCRQKMPRREDLDIAIQLAIDTMKAVVKREPPASPSELRLSAIGRMIEDFICENQLNKNYDTRRTKEEARISQSEDRRTE